MLTQAQLELLSLVTGQAAPGAPPVAAGPATSATASPGARLGTPVSPGAPPPPAAAPSATPGDGLLPGLADVGRQIVDGVVQVGQQVGVVPPPPNPMKTLGDLVGEAVKGQLGGGQPAQAPACDDALPSRVLSMSDDGGTAVIHFCQDSHELTGSARATLDQLAAMVSGSSDFSMQLMAHASKDGDEARNKALSEQRGETVKAYLAGKGLDGGEIEVLAEGSSQASGDAPRDRNVLIVLKLMADMLEPGDDGKVRTALYSSRSDGSGGELHIFFARDASQLEASAVSALGLCADECKPYLGAMKPGAIRVYATASLDGELEHNKDLAKLRALAVQTVLGVTGIPSDIVQVHGDPPTDEFSKSDPSANRRAKVIWDLPQPGTGVPPPGAQPGAGSAPPPASAPGASPPAPGSAPPAEGGAPVPPPPPGATPPGDDLPIPGGLPVPGGDAQPGTPPAGSDSGAPPAEGGSDALPSRLGKQTDAFGSGVLYFAKDSAQLTGSARQVLDACLKHCKPGSSEVDLTGYASNEGQDGHNKSLAQARVDAVKAYLTGKGLDDGGIQAIGVGPTDQFSKSDLAPNRRVELAWTAMQVLAGDQDGGVPPAQVSQSKHGGSANLFFAKDATAVTPSGRKALDMIVADSRAPGAQLADGCIQVIGLASTGGSDAHNKQVASARAEACKAYLVSQGIEARFVMAIGQGSTEEYSKKDPAQNRRAMIAWKIAAAPAAPAPGSTPQKRPPARIQLSFPTGSAALDGRCKAELDALGDLTQAQAVSIDAYCSLDGQPAQNKKLSEQRAKAVSDHLASKGVPARLIKAVGHGGTDQFSKQDPAANRVTLVAVDF